MKPTNPTELLDLKPGDYVWYRNHGVGIRIWASVVDVTTWCVKIKRPKFNRRWIRRAWLVSKASTPEPERLLRRKLT